MNRIKKNARLTPFLTLLAGLFVVAACGQSGALYIPGNPSQLSVPPSGNDTTDGDENSADESDDDSARAPTTDSGN